MEHRGFNKFFVYSVSLYLFPEALPGGEFQPAETLGSAHEDKSSGEDFR